MFPVTDGALDRALYADLLFLPYRHGGRGPDAYDCYGLLMELYQRAGTPIAPVTPPTSDDGIDSALTGILPLWQRCPVRPGAALLFRDDGRPRHVGVALDEDRFIHAAVRNGMVAIDHLSRPWGRLFIAAYEPRVQD